MGKETQQVSAETEMEPAINDLSPKDEKPTPSGDTPPQQSRTTLFLLLVAAFVSMFLVALDRTIITTAIPRITDEFNSLPDIGWYGGAYLLTSCSFQLLFGKLYAFFPVKPIFLATTLLFEVGSVVCGAAPSSIAFIVGRAVCGVGAAGIFSGCIMIIVHAVPLEKRPRVQGLFGAVFGVASVLGPLVGGAFTSNVTWRWCFYINLPFGGLAMVVLAFCLKIPRNDANKLSWSEKVLQLDFPGTTALVPAVVCLLLALQWGGQKYAWSDGRIIALLTLAGCLLVAFMAVQIWLPRTATLPPRIFRQRSVVAGFLMIFSLMSAMYIFVFFLPLWFQSITGVSAVESGIRFLPTVLAQVVAVIGGGFATQKIGYYTPFAIAGACIMSVGAGLLTSLDVHTGEGMWIGYQILFGFGTGLCMQAPNLAAQTVLPKMDVPIGISLMVFAQGFGPAIFTSVGQNVLDNQLLQRLSWLPGFHPTLITSGGATSLINALAPDLRAAALTDYNLALRKVFQIGLILSCLSTIGAVFLEWKSTQKKQAAKAATPGDEAGQKAPGIETGPSSDEH